MMKAARGFRWLSVGGLVAAGVCAPVACTPKITRDPIPEEMEFDPEAAPPRVPEPTSIIVNPMTGRLDFGLADIKVPAGDCAMQEEMSRAQCEFYQYLQSLDGYPTVTPARTPTTADMLDPATLGIGSNVVLVEAKTGAVLGDANVEVGFDAGSRYLTIAPKPSWGVGKFYWAAVRGNAGGVRAVSATGARSEVVGSAAQALLKQETSLSCGATSAVDVDPHCPAAALLAQGRPETETDAEKAAAAAESVIKLEHIRAGYAAAGAWDAIAAAGLPKSEVAILWGFPIHSASVPELDPTAGLVPRATAPDELHIAVQGPVDPATVSAFVVSVQSGSVVTMDLTAVAAGNLLGGLPVTDATYAGGDIVIKARRPFEYGHQYGIFLKRSIQAPGGAPLVASPVTVLLTARGALVDEQGHSNVSAVADADAAMLEAGRLQLAPLLDEPTIQQLTGITREQLVYCFAFLWGLMP
jgi:hypothetical protein